MKLCTLAAHGPRALRPFPDADAPISCSGNAARLTTFLRFCKMDCDKISTRRNLGGHPGTRDTKEYGLILLLRDTPDSDSDILEITVKSGE